MREIKFKIGNEEIDLTRAKNKKEAIYKILYSMKISVVSYRDRFDANGSTVDYPVFIGTDQMADSQGNQDISFAMNNALDKFFKTYNKLAKKGTKKV